MTQPKVSYPTLEKIQSVSGDSQKIGEFLDWLTTQQHYHICVWNTKREYFDETGLTITELLALYFDIDEDKAEKERKAILAALSK